MHKKGVKKGENRLQSDKNNNKKSSTYSPSKMQPTLAAELPNCEADPPAASQTEKNPGHYLTDFFALIGKTCHFPPRYHWCMLKQVFHKC